MKETIYFKPYKLLKMPLLITTAICLLIAIAIFIYGFFENPTLENNYGALENFPWHLQMFSLFVMMTASQQIIFFALMMINIRLAKKQKIQS